MRILHVLDHSIPLHSGYTFRTLAILREQRNRGWETFHLTGPKQVGCIAHEEDVEGWHFFRTLVAQSRQSSVPWLDQYAAMRATEHRLLEVAMQIKPDFVHAHSPVLNAIPALRVARQLRVPVVYEVRAFWEDAAVDHGTIREGSMRYRATRALETYALKRVHHVTTICEGLRADIVARGIPSDRVTVIPNAVDIELFGAHGDRDTGLATALGLAGKRVIGFIGSFYAYEGLDLLLEALPDIARRCPDVRLLLVGGGPQESTLKVLCRKLNLEDRVVFAGRVPHSDVRKYYNSIDILVYPRHPMRLTELVTPLKPLEAMAQERLLIASDVGGHRELIRDGENGVLFRAGSSASLCDAVCGLLLRPEIWAGLRRAGRVFVEQERNWAKSVARYEGVYATARRHDSAGRRSTAGKKHHESGFES